MLTTELYAPSPAEGPNNSQSFFSTEDCSRRNFRAVL